MNATARARLNVALSMAIFGTLPLFVRQVHASSAMIALLRAAIALIALAIFGGSSFMLPALLPILIHTHSRIRINKWVFYLYYPTHLILIYLLDQFVF